MRKILVVFGHPSTESFCGALYKKYVEGVKKSKNELKTLIISDLKFDFILEKGFKGDQTLEPDLVKAQESIKWADHIVFVYPTWWASPPAILKGFIERVLMPGFAFGYNENSLFVEKYLTNKTARLIVTMDSPPWYYKWRVGDPGYKIMKDILHFVGIKPVRKNYFGSIKMSSEEIREKWLQEVYKIGLNDP